MHKQNLLAFLSFLTIFLLSGCVQEPLDLKNNDTFEQEKSSNINKTEKNTTEPSTENAKEENPSSSMTTKDPTGKVSSNLPRLKVHYINVGQADSTLLQYSQGNEDYTILIDAGNWNRNYVVNYLNSQNVSEIDVAVGTHPDADHIGQLDKVLNTFDVGEVWLSGNTSTSQTFQRLLTAVDSSGVDYYEPRMGDEFEIGPLEVDVLYPRSISENDNEESLSLKLTYGDVQFIFTGDASTNDELKMVHSGLDLQADILHLGHHGSSTSTHPTFLKAVQPSIAIYSAGMDNSYGHPHEEVVNLIQNSGIQLYGTDVHGTVIVSTDGKDYKVLTKKDGTITPTSNKDMSNNNVTNKQDLNRKAPQSSNRCIDINSATIEQVQEIVHIGPARAENLINSRPYSSVDDLTKISGLGPARIADIKTQGLACIGG